MPDLKKEKQDAEKGIFRIIHYLCTQTKNQSLQNVRTELVWIALLIPLVLDNITRSKMMYSLLKIAIPHARMTKALTENKLNLTQALA